MVLFNKEKNLNSQELTTVYSLRVFTDDKHLSARRIFAPWPQCTQSHVAGEKARWLRAFVALMEDPVLVPSSHVGEPVRVTSDSYNSVTSEENRVVFIHCFPSALGHNCT